jgi:hypothetical protein
MYINFFPDSVYGHYWRGRVNYELDTTMTVEPFTTIMIEEYRKTLDAAALDKIRFKTPAINAAQLLAGYYNNIKSNKDTALMYTNRGLEFDSTNATLKYIKQVLTQQNQPPKKGNSKPTGKIKVLEKTAAIKS